ncbi:MAG: hypothetical protein ABI760_24800 [Ferruginibacter sp.]
MDFILCVSGNDFSLNDITKELAAEDSSYNIYADKPFRGNMNTTTIRTIRGRTIMLQHNVSSPRPKTGMFPA